MKGNKQHTAVWPRVKDGMLTPTSMLTPRHVFKSATSSGEIGAASRKQEVEMTNKTRGNVTGVNEVTNLLLFLLLLLCLLCFSFFFLTKLFSFL